MASISSKYGTHAATPFRGLTYKFNCGVTYLSVRIVRSTLRENSEYNPPVICVPPHRTRASLVVVDLVLLRRRQVGRIRTMISAYLILF